jgi:hypothetical protein
MRYRLTEDEYLRIMAASRRGRIPLGGKHKPPPEKKSVLDEWRKVAERVGCDPDSIMPAGTASMRDFVGTPLDEGDS